MARREKPEVSPEMDAWAHKLVERLYRRDLSPGQWNEPLRPSWPAPISYRPSSTSSMPGWWIAEGTCSATGPRSPGTPTQTAGSGTGCSLVERSQSLCAGCGWPVCPKSLVRIGDRPGQGPERDRTWRTSPIPASSGDEDVHPSFHSSGQLWPSPLTCRLSFLCENGSRSIEPLRSPSHPAML